MADGRNCPSTDTTRCQITDTIAVNDARAMRVAEIMNDFRTIQLRISQYQVTPSASEYHEAGFGILRQCHAEAQAVLSTHFDPGVLQTPSSTGEQTKRQLQRYEPPKLCPVELTDKM